MPVQYLLPLVNNLWSGVAVTRQLLLRMAVKLVCIPLSDINRPAQCSLCFLIRNVLSVHSRCPDLSCVDNKCILNPPAFPHPTHASPLSPLHALNAVSTKGFLGKAHKAHLLLCVTCSAADYWKCHTGQANKRLLLVF